MLLWCEAVPYHTRFIVPMVLCQEFCCSCKAYLLHYHGFIYRPTTKSVDQALARSGADEELSKWEVFSSWENNIAINGLMTQLAQSES